MGNLFTEEVGKVLTGLLGNYLTEALGKVLDIYMKSLRQPDLYVLHTNELLILSSDELIDSNGGFLQNQKAKIFKPSDP